MLRNTVREDRNMPVVPVIRNGTHLPSPAQAGLLARIGGVARLNSMFARF
jgi:hypothetical protein